MCLSRYGIDKEMRNEKGILNDVCVSTLASLDNKTSIFEISYKNNMSFSEVYNFCEILKEKGLIEEWGTIQESRGNLEKNRSVTI